MTKGRPQPLARGHGGWGCRLLDWLPQLLLPRPGSRLPCPTQRSTAHTAQHVCAVSVFVEKRATWRRSREGRGLGGSWLTAGGGGSTGGPTEAFQGAAAWCIVLQGPGRTVPAAFLGPGIRDCSLSLLGGRHLQGGQAAAIPPEHPQDQAIKGSGPQQPQVAVDDGSQGVLQLCCGDRRRGCQASEVGPHCPCPGAFQRAFSLAPFILGSDNIPALCVRGFCV